MISIQILCLIFQLDKLYICFLKKKSCFIAIIVPLTAKMIDQFRMVNSIGWSIPADS
jgi:hypothetical protein